MYVILCRDLFHQFIQTCGKSLWLLVSLIEMSVLNTGSLIIPGYIICSHLLQLSSALAHLAYGQPPTHTQAQHKYTYSHIHIFQDVRGSSHHVWLSIMFKRVLGFPSSAMVSCQNRKLLYMMGYFLRLPLDTGTQRFFDFHTYVC